MGASSAVPRIPSLPDDRSLTACNAFDKSTVSSNETRIVGDPPSTTRPEPGLIESTFGATLSGISESTIGELSTSFPTESIARTCTETFVLDELRSGARNENSNGQLQSSVTREPSRYN